MGVIDYTNLEDGTPITANIFNERYGDILAELNGGLDEANFSAGGIPAAALATDVFQKIYPVGSIYMNAINATNPGELLGFGTWIAFAAGKVMVGYDATDSDFNASEKTGGAKTTTLTTGQLPSHNHSISTDGAHTHLTHVDYNVALGSGEIVTGAASDPRGNATDSAGSHTHTIGSIGSGEAHSNMNPFITVYMWKRTA